MMASFTPEQEAFIEKIVFRVAPMFLKVHQEACPWGQRLRRWFWMGVGASAVLTLLGMTTIPGVREFVHKITG